MHPDYGGDTFLWNTGNHVQTHTAPWQRWPRFIATNLLVPYRRKSYKVRDYQRIKKACHQCQNCRSKYVWSSRLTVGNKYWSLWLPALGSLSIWTGSWKAAEATRNTSWPCALSVRQVGQLQSLQIISSHLNRGKWDTAHNKPFYC
jgi:hypothetical protein